RNPADIAYTFFSGHIPSCTYRREYGIRVIITVARVTFRLSRDGQEVAIEQGVMSLHKHPQISLVRSSSFDARYSGGGICCTQMWCTSIEIPDFHIIDLIHTEIGHAGESQPMILLSECRPYQTIGIVHEQLIPIGLHTCIIKCFARDSISCIRGQEILISSFPKIRRHLGTKLEITQDLVSDTRRSHQSISLGEK